MPGVSCLLDSSLLGLRMCAFRFFHVSFGADGAVKNWALACSSRDRNCFFKSMYALVSPSSLVAFHLALAVSLLALGSMSSGIMVSHDLGQ